MFLQKNIYIKCRFLYIMLFALQEILYYEKFLIKKNNIRLNNFTYKYKNLLKNRLNSYHYY